MKQLQNEDHRSLQSDTITFFTNCNNLPRPDCNFAKIASRSHQKFNWLYQNSITSAKIQRITPKVQLVAPKVQMITPAQEFNCNMKYAADVTAEAFQSDPIQKGQLAQFLFTR